MAIDYDNGISILPANGYFAEDVDRLFCEYALSHHIIEEV